METRAEGPSRAENAHPGGPAPPTPFTESDLALLHALQLAPRIPWSALAPVLGASPTALAARWARLRERRLAWLCASPPSGVGGATAQRALVEVDCALADLDTVVSALEALPFVRGLAFAARGRQLVLTLAASSFAELSRLLLDEVSRVPGITALRSHLGTMVHRDGGGWRLGALDPAQCATIGAHPRATRTRAPLTAGPIDLQSPVYAPLVAALAEDSRTRAVDLAVRTGRPAATIRRQVNRLLGAGALVLRCELAQPWTGRPVAGVWWCAAPPVRREAALARLCVDPRVRLCLSTTGPAALVVTAWTSGLLQADRFQTRLEELLGAGAVLDSAILLRTRKRAGRLLAPDGRRA
ncbi:Lrp/AsnC family transcriptional regulator [Streptomyces sp. Tu6071]|uniref:Lrp/AsnC family transcriptional regulator n=1 Tax=Streptomyces sp. Tu6071 TaxID=355249 RepID=UPI0002EFD149|nr:Lrp/AsnC family transcriptional regulator [Streptomyces sp. Tu6071]